MSNYWDLTEAKRSLLSEDELDGFVDYALMAEGVVRPRPPVATKTNPPRPETCGIFRIKINGTYGRAIEVGFTTLDQAQAFLDLCPVTIETDYKSGNVEFVKPLSGAEIVLAQVATAESIATLAEDLRRFKAEESARLASQREYESAKEKADAVEGGLREDWQSLVKRRLYYETIADKLAEYVKLAGEKEIAMKFLGKAYGEEDIAAAAEWGEL